jgi:hypothetical protein
MGKRVRKKKTWDGLPGSDFESDPVAPLENTRMHDGQADEIPGRRGNTRISRIFQED